MQAKKFERALKGIMGTSDFELQEVGLVRRPIPSKLGSLPQSKLTTL